MPDLEYITKFLLPEFLRRFSEWNAEYPDERPLGARAEWHGIHRKVGKLKRPLWDGEPWDGREDERTMLLEIIGHAFLAITSLDEERSPENYPAPPVQLADVLRANMGVDYGHPNANPLIGMTEQGKERLRRMRAEHAGQVMANDPKAND